ncbi:MAG TPA: 5-formyltetrahydrofolate cyclo-ligase [Janthinobacterium sp.]|nr:5-formyltetrahydrofolate cyclo-ligase [Janthinobacterium sp.]
MRKALLSRRRGLDQAARTGWDGAIGARILAWCEQRAVPALGVYWALQGEPELGAAYAELARRGVRLLLPVVVEKDAPLRFAAWTPGEAMLKDGMGVAVPAQRRLEATPPALLVPCLGFNAARLRLGYGGGFYDRTLAQAPRPATLGIAYACMAAEFDGDAHDIALDNIATESDLI